MFEQSQNFRHQNGDMKHVPHWKPPNIRHHDTKSGQSGDLPHGIWAPLMSTFTFTTWCITLVDSQATRIYGPHSVKSSYFLPAKSWVVKWKKMKLGVKKATLKRRNWNTDCMNTCVHTVGLSSFLDPIFIRTKNIKRVVTKRCVTLKSYDRNWVLRNINDSTANFINIYYSIVIFVYFYFYFNTCKNCNI